MTKLIILTIILASSSGPRPIYKTVYFNTLEECIAVLEVTKIVVPNGADDNEWIGSATCGYKERE